MLFKKDSIEYAIAMLMARPSLTSNVRLAPESQECIRFADTMRRHTSQGRYKGIWGHIPNEGARSRLTGAIMRAMGLIPGGGDYYFIWQGGACLIEFKAGERMGWRKDKYVKIKPGTLSDNQKFFQTWCAHCDINYYVCYTTEEAESRLKSLGGLV